MFSSTMRQLPQITNYETADRFFTNTRRPRTSRWAEHQRPLRNTAQTHYRIERKNDGEHYDLVLYGTVMGRLYRPAEDGSQRRLYINHYSNTSKQYLDRVCDMRTVNRKRTTTGEIVIAPMYMRECVTDYDGKGFSIDMTFTNAGLDVSRSSHTPHVKFVSTDADKQDRKRILKNFENYVMLAVMRMPEFKANVDLDVRAGQPFSSGTHSGNFKHALLDMDAGTASQAQLNHFFEMCQDTYNTLASKRGYKQKNFILSNYWRSNTTVSTIDELEQPITEKDFAKSVNTRLLRILHGDAKSGKQPIPQFPREEEYTASNAWTHG
jgi:hypothetical protein